MKKKFILILTVIACICFSTALFTACKPNEESKTPPPEVSVIKFLDLPKSMVVGDVKKLTYVFDGEDESSLKFSSSDTSVAVIDSNATVEGLRVGQTVISAECGDDKAEFTLTVVKNDELPQLLFNNYIADDGLTVVKNGKVSLDAYVFYNGREFYDAEIDYVLDDEQLASIDDAGMLTALNKGKITVTVVAKWREIESTLLTKTIVVNVVNDVQLLLSEGELFSVKLYTKDYHGGKSFDTSFDLSENAKFIVDGADVTADTTFSLQENDESSPIVNYDEQNKILTANRHGKAKLVASYDDGTEIFSNSVEVIVERPTFEYSENIYFSQTDGEIVELNEIFGEEVSLVEAYQGGTEKTGEKLTLDGNIITDYRIKDSGQYQKDTITLYTEDCGVQVNVTASHKIIRTASDLTSLYSTDSANYKTTGYFLVANDIKYDESVVLNPVYTNYGAGSKFSGVFDGNGHTIEYGLNKGGLFGNLEKATVKNASFVVKSVKTEGTTQTTDLGMYVILAGYMANSTIENVYATYDVEFTPTMTKIGTAYRFRGLGLFAASNVGTINNVVLNLNNVKGNVALNADVAYGVLLAPISGDYYYGTVNNSYVIWENDELCFYPIYRAATADTAERLARVAYAGNDADYQLPSSFNSEEFGKTQLGGVTRFNDYDAAKEYFANNSFILEDFSSFVDVSRGFPYEGSEKYLMETLGTIYFDGEEGDEALLPESLNGQKIGSIVDADDNSVKYFENGTWNISKNTTNEKVFYTAMVCGEDGALIGRVSIVSVAKVISKASDLTSVYGNTTSAVTTSGYFYVANDIKYDESVEIKPVFTNWGEGSKFSGVFDGNGHTIEYGIIKGGLFGNLEGSSTIIKDAAFVVKKVNQETTNGDNDFGMYAIIAGFNRNAQISNVYATYDVEFTADLGSFSLSNNLVRYRGLGLFAASHCWSNTNVKDVILDLSKVKGITSGDGNYGYGVLLAPVSTYSLGAISNSYVIWNVKELFKHKTTSLNKIMYAASDTDYDTTVEGVTYTKLNSVSRYDTLTVMAEKVRQVGNFTISENGVTWANS